MINSLIRLANHLDLNNLNKEADFLDIIIKKYAEDLDSSKVEDRFEFLCRTYLEKFELEMSLGSFLPLSHLQSMWEDTLNSLEGAANSLSDPDVVSEIYPDFNSSEIEDLARRLLSLVEEIRSACRSRLSSRQGGSLQAASINVIREKIMSMYEGDNRL